MNTQVLACLLFLALGTNETEAQDRIINGHRAKLGQIPFQALLIYHRGDPGDGYIKCGGSLIHPMWVLTAGHCIVDFMKFLDVSVGGIDVDLMPYKQRVGMSGRIAHSKYNPSTLENDIGLVKVPTPFELNANVKVVLMAPEDPYSHLIGMPAYISGFGNTEMGETATLKWTQVDIISNDKCKLPPKSISNITLTDNTMCTTEAKYAGGCSGDTGGPLYSRNHVEPMLIGVTSWVYLGLQGCQGAISNGFMRVSAYRGWIRETMGIGHLSPWSTH